MVTGKLFPWFHTGGLQYRVAELAREVPDATGYGAIADTGELGVLDNKTHAFRRTSIRAKNQMLLGRSVLIRRILPYSFPSPSAQHPG